MLLLGYFIEEVRWEADIALDTEFLLVLGQMQEEESLQTIIIISASLEASSKEHRF